MAIDFNAVIPVLRIFDIAKADEFYLGFLGFAIDWDHRFHDNGPLYRQISRGNLILHLSEHHGDACPGAYVRVMMDGVEALQRELIGKGYRYMNPGLQTMPWSMVETGVIDPFGNTIRFCQPIDQQAPVA
ncbi:MAG TPA: glyoxalase superfamily protein [Stellaceae bacterium]|nr:glyoxalase superfamily protein [Stellaceae bacterium]